MDKRRYPRLSLDLLRGFHAAARHSSFTRAAAELFVTQPAISREIKTLEEQIGQALFRRVNRSLELTPAGEELHRCADEVFALIDKTIARLAGTGATLAVTAPVPFASLWLGPRLTRFTSLHPEVQLRIVASNDLDNLHRGQLDVAIRFMPLGKDVPDGEFLADYKMFPICSPALLRDPKRPLSTPSDLVHHVLLDFETIIDGRRWCDWDKWFAGMKMRPIKTSKLLRFSHYDQVIQAVVSDGGVAIGKWPHLTSELRDGVVCAPFGRDCVAGIGSMFIVAAEAAAGSDVVASFTAWLRSEVERDEEQMPALIRGHA